MLAGRSNLALSFLDGLEKHQRYQLTTSQCFLSVTSCGVQIDGQF
jgi:hypothetical protein